MRRMFACAPVFALLLGACAATDAPMAPGVQSTMRAESEDPWALVIEAERYSYLISLANEGAIEGPPAMIAPNPEDLERVSRALHYAAHELYALRARVCETGLAGSDDCGELPPPAWMGEPAGAAIDAGEARLRIDWLTGAMWPFVEAGCDAGRSRQEGDGPDYCAVE